jgi:hypothetical protein
MHSESTVSTQTIHPNFWHPTSRPLSAEVVDDKPRRQPTPLFHESSPRFNSAKFFLGKRTAVLGRVLERAPKKRICRKPRIHESTGTRKTHRLVNTTDMTQGGPGTLFAHRSGLAPGAPLVTRQPCLQPSQPDAHCRGALGSRWPARTNADRSGIPPMGFAAAAACRAAIRSGLFD